MTAYHGGKQRIGKEIAETILKKSKKYIDNNKIRGYCEPFCGMLGVYQHIPDYFHSKFNYLAGDINKSVITMWKKTQKGWKPPTSNISKKKILELKESSDSNPLKGFYGSLHSFRGIFYGSYFPHNQSKIKLASEKVRKIAKKLKEVKFKHGNYKQFSKLKGFIIYCDPPYSHTQQRYYTTNRSRNSSHRKHLKFDEIEFYKWCIKMSKNNLIFISEYKIPKYIKKYCKLIWKQSKKNNNKIEKLYMIKTSYYK